MPLLDVRDLRVSFAAAGEASPAVDGVSLRVDDGETVGIVGESGCGKTVTALAILGLLPRRGVRVTGRVDFAGTDLLGLSPRRLREHRGRDLAMIFQDSGSTLNPVVPVGLQVAEVLQRHRGQDRRAARRAAASLLDEVGIDDPRSRLHDYPHELSGGMRQRVLIAIALACRPRLLIADEPTSSLDVTVQAQVLALLRDLVERTGAALVLITHDLGVVAATCQTVSVWYAGRVVETVDAHRLFATPRHPYARGLLGSMLRLDSTDDSPPVPIPAPRGGPVPWAQGCAFAPRCDRHVDACVAGTPALSAAGLRCVNPGGDQ